MSFNHDLFTKRLQRIRTIRRMTQEEVANRAGIAPNYYSNLETGERIPSLEAFVSICNALQVDANYMLFDSLDILNAAEISTMESGRYFFLQPQAEMDMSQS